jgi:hypothetical protein
MGKAGARRLPVVAARQRRPTRPADGVTARTVGLVGVLDRVPSRQRAGALAGLVPQLGNQRVVAAIDGPPVVQRQAVFGLQRSDQVGGFAGDVDAFCRANPTRTLADLCAFMIDRLNVQLAANGVPKLPVPKLDALRTAGGFAAASWTVQFDVVRTATRPLTAALADVPPERLQELAGIFYHECRHAEQAFLVARLVASEPGGPKDAKALAAQLELHEPTAAAALRATGPPPTGKDALEKIRGWRAYDKGGKHHDYWDWNESLQQFAGNVSRSIPDPRPDGADAIRAEMGKLSVTLAEWRRSTVPFADTKLAALKALKRPDATDAQVRRDLTTTRRVLGKIMDAEARTTQQLGRLATRQAQPRRLAVDEARTFQAAIAVPWLGLVTALAELVVVTGSAYEAYAHEADAYATQRAVMKELAAKRRARPKKP